MHPGDLARQLGCALLTDSAIALPLAGVLAMLPRTMLAPVRLVLVALLIPAACIVLGARLQDGRLHDLVPPVLQLRPPLGHVVGVLPFLLLPVLGTIARLPSGQNRAGSGLGAGPMTMLRLVWLPQLAPPLLFGLVLAALLDVAALLPNPPSIP